jgi:hypothetical protein
MGSEFISYQVSEKVNFHRLLKNAQMHGSQNPEECGVLGGTPQRRRMRGTPQMGIFEQPDRHRSIFGFKVNNAWSRFQ